MNKQQVKNIKNWIAALRSGDYEQGQGQLCILPDSEDDTPQYCCLGVACHLTKKGKKRPTRWAERSFLPPSIVNFHERFGLDKEFLPRDADMGSSEADAIQCYLADLNDGDELSFAQIARKIEQLAIRQLKAEGRAHLWDEVQV